MAPLLKKVWGWVLRAPGEGSTSTASTEAAQAQLQLSLGEVFDPVPNDVFLQIMRLAGPRAAARTSTVCKGWRILVSDDRLWLFFLQNGSEPWNAATFAEMKLRSGLPSMYKGINLHRRGSFSKTQVKFMHQQPSVLLQINHPSSCMPWCLLLTQP